MVGKLHMSLQQDLPRVVTVSLIAERLNVPHWRVHKSLRRLGIEPVARADDIGCFFSDAIDRVRREIERTCEECM